MTGEGARLLSVNLAVARTNPFKQAVHTGIDKQPTDASVDVRAPGSKEHGLGSGLEGDFIGDRRSHGGDDQAVYAYASEDLQWWADQLGESLTFGRFGENFTTSGIDVNNALVGERWRVGDTVELQVTDPRIPCGTFRGWMNRAGWLKTFVEAARPGTYLRVLRSGTVSSGDSIDVIERPNHDVTVAKVFRAVTAERELLPDLLEASDLTEETRDMAVRRIGFDIV
jgi:MOSC domain-containing protein YiiM